MNGSIDPAFVLDVNEWSQQTSIADVNLSTSPNTSDNTDCGYSEAEEEETHLADVCQFWLEGVLLILFGLLGLLGNSLSVKILCGTNMRKSSFNQLLIVLILFDNTFIIFAMLDYACVRVFSWPVSLDSSLYALVFTKLLYPLNNIAICCSIGLTVAISLERYIAVCHPFYYRELTTARGVTMRAALYVGPVILLSTILNIPKFLETELVYEPETVNNRTVTRLTYEITELRQDPDYIRYYQNWCRLIFTVILPVSFLIFFNTKIFHGIKYTHQKATNRNVSGELNLATVLICIVIVFFVCHIPRVILNFIDVFRMDLLIACPHFMPSNAHLCLSSLNHFLLIINASINFIIYTSLGDTFNKSLKEFLQRYSIFKMVISSQKNKGENSSSNGKLDDKDFPEDTSPLNTDGKTILAECKTPTDRNGQDLNGKCEV